MISLTVIGLLLPLAASQEPAADPDGQAIYTQSCALCHGDAGSSFVAESTGCLATSGPLLGEGQGCSLRIFTRLDQVAR